MNRNFDKDVKAWIFMIGCVLFKSGVPVFFLLGGATYHTGAVDTKSLAEIITFTALTLSFTAIFGLLIAWVTAPRESQCARVAVSWWRRVHREWIQLKRAGVAVSWRRWVRRECIQSKRAGVAVRQMWLRSWITGVVGALCNAEPIFYILAAGFVSPTIVVILHETWPIVLIGLISLVGSFRRSQSRPDFRSVALWLAFGICIVGILILASGELPGPRLFSRFKGVTSDHWIGVGLAFAASVTGALHVACSRLMAHRLSERFHDRDSTRTSPLFFESASYVCTRGLGAIICIGAALLWGESISGLGIALAALGALFLAGGGLTLRMAQRLSSTYAINVATYFTPILSIIFVYVLLKLMWIKGEETLELHVFLIGAAAIISGNLMVGFSIDRSIAFKGLILSVWSFGLWVYIRDAPQFDLYFAAIAAVITVFVLLVSFRTDRLVERIKDEESEVLWLWQTIRGDASPGYTWVLRGFFSKLTTSWKDADIREAHENLRGYHAFDENGVRDRERCQTGKLVKFRKFPLGIPSNEVQVRIDKLSNSKQQGSNEGERFVIFLLGTVAIVGMLLFRPKYEMQNICIDLVVNIFAFVLSAIIVFLYCWILDLEKDRRLPRIDLKTKGLSFRDEYSHRLTVWFAVAASILLVAMYSYLLWTKAKCILTIAV